MFERIDFEIQKNPKFQLLIFKFGIF
jgi:hypothetical protein